MSDPCYLLVLLTYSTFMNQIKSERSLAAVKKLLENTPVVDVSARTKGAVSVD